MKKKVLSILFALVLVLSLSLVTAVPVGAQTINVSSGESIQAAVTAAAPGATIIVQAGVYDEQVEINKALTLQGVGDGTVIQPAAELTATSDIPWIGTGTGTMAAIVEVKAPGGTVIIKDLKIDGSLIPSKATTWVAGLVYLETSGKVEGVTVFGNGALPDRTAGIFAAAITNPASLEVTGCTVIGYNRAGIYALGEMFVADYHHNEINGPGPIPTGVPNGMFFLRGATGSATYNIVTDLGYTGEGEYRSTGIGTYNAGTDVTFAYNTISNVQNAFALSTGTSGTIVEYNDIFNNHTGVRIEAAAINSIIQYNDIHGNDFAIRCGADMEDGNEAHYNNFVNNLGSAWTNEDEDPPNTYIGAVCNVHPTFILDATNNWWGTKGESEIQAMVSPNVDFYPWLTSEWPSSAVGLTATPPKEIIGISVLPSEIDFGAIQSGDIVTGDTLAVTNIGTALVEVSAAMNSDTIYDGTTFFYTDALKLNGALRDGTVDGGFGSWTATVLELTSITVNDSGDVTTGLVCPAYIKPGVTYTGTILFVATIAE